MNEVVALARYQNQHCFNYCFMAGMNQAWINFGGDVGDKSMDINSLTSKIRLVRKARGNVLRWWIHTDASNCCGSGFFFRLIS